MTKKKKILNGIIFLGGLIVFAIYYFQDNGDMGAKEEEQENNAIDSAEVKLPDLSEDLAEFEENNATAEQDSVMKDSI
jgi:flagellar basal body-associated protein FliL